MTARLPIDGTPALADYKLSDNLTATRGRIFLTGTQALVRLALMQRAADRAQRPEHGRLHQRLSRLAARHGRPAVVESEETAHGE